MPCDLFKNAFDSIRTKLIKHLDLTGTLIEELIARKVLIEEQRDCIEVILVKHKKTACLLDYLVQRPDADFDRFVEALKETGQSDIYTDLLLPNIRKFNPSYKQRKLGKRHRGDDDDDDDVTDDLPPVVVEVTTRQFYDKNCHKAYRMRRATRGVACIINIKTTKGHDVRGGTDVDRDRLQQLFTKLHFHPCVYNDLTAKRIVKRVKETAAMRPDEHKPQCYVLFILSHGGLDGSRQEVLYGKDGKPVAKKEILELLTDEETQRNLAGVPRLVCFVSCRGERGNEEEEADSIALPGDHFIVGLPCQEEFVSFRSPSRGTRYVRCLVDLLMKECHNTDVETILSQKMKDELQKLTRNGGEHQRADYLSTLDKDKKLFLFPGISR